MKTFLSQLNWRNATKAFDTSKPVAEPDLKRILESIRMAPTSFGLQPFRVVVVKDTAVKEQIRKVGWGQVQYTTASHVLAFVSRTAIDQRIDGMLDISSGGDATRKAQLKVYEEMMRGWASKMDRPKAKAWADRQAYIALGFAMAACAELGIDSCPMEGFDPPEVDKILGVKDGEFTCVMLPIGYRDPSQAVRPKVRFPESDLFSTI